jgi:cell division protein FtsX
MEMLLDMAHQNVQEALKKFQDIKNKEYEKTQKQINELIGSLNKYQSETEDPINRQINELKIKIDNIKEEVTHDMEKLRKKNETEIQNKNRRPFQQTRTSRRQSQNLKIKWKLKEKLKSY